MPREPSDKVRASYRFQAANVDVAIDDASTGRWLAEFVTPWFSPGAPGKGTVSVHWHSSTDDFAALATRRGSAFLTPVACFGLDSALVSCPGWVEPDGTTIAYDTTFFCYYQMRERDIEIVAEPGHRQARMGLLRTVREVATTLAQNGDMLDLHAAAFVWRGRAVLVVGDKAAGKTTLLAHALASGHADLLANDRVMVAPDGEAYGVPTVVSLREYTQRMFPAIAAGLPGQAALLDTDELAAHGSGHEQPNGSARLSPAQFAGRLGVRLVAAAPVGAIVFPEVTAGVPAVTLLPMTPAEGTARLPSCLYASRSGPRQPTWFRRQTDFPSAPPTQSALAEDLGRQVPMLRALLGPDAYRESAERWLATLPLAGEAVPS